MTETVTEPATEAASPPEPPRYWRPPAKDRKTIAVIVLLRLAGVL